MYQVVQFIKSLASEISTLKYFIF